jgi:hypothetical protein
MFPLRINWFCHHKICIYSHLFFVLIILYYFRLLLTLSLAHLYIILKILNHQSVQILRTPFDFFQYIIIFISLFKLIFIITIGFHPSSNLKYIILLLLFEWLFFLDVTILLWMFQIYLRILLTKFFRKLWDLKSLIMSIMMIMMMIIF